jgi:hypothetical protein
MSAGCPHRHLSYANWRLQVFRGLFSLSHYQDVLQGAAGKFPHLRHQVRDHGKLTTSPNDLHGDRWDRSECRDRGYEDGPRSTISPELINPLISLRSNVRPRNPSIQIRHYSRTESCMSGGKFWQKRTAKNKIKSYKKIEDEEAAAFLEEATSRVIGPRMPEPIDPYEPQLLSTSRPQPEATMRMKNATRKSPKTQKQIEEEDAAAFLEEATKRVTSSRMAGQQTAIAKPHIMPTRVPRGVGQKKAPKISPRTRKQIEDEEAEAFLEAATKRLSTLPIAEQPKKPTKSQESSMSIPLSLRILRKETSGSTFQLRAKQMADEDAAVLGEAMKRVNGLGVLQQGTISTPPKTQAERGSLAFLEQIRKHANYRRTSRLSTSPAQLQGSSLAEQRMRKQQTSELPELQGTSTEENVHTENSTAERAASTRNTTANPDSKPAGADGSIPSHTLGEPIQGELIDESSGEELQRWFREALERAQDHEQRLKSSGVHRKAHAKFYEATLNPWKHKASKRTFSTKSVERSLSTRNMPNEIEPQSRPDDLPALQRDNTGILSSSEREDLSSLLSSLRSRDGNVLASQPKVEFPSLAKSLPLSPYQRLQAKERHMKDQAKAEAKQRLQNNPWAEWLASPVRMCQATGVRLPKKLMVGWNFIRNPEDSQVYLMPEELVDMAHLGSIEGPNSRSSIRQDNVIIRESTSGDPAVEDKHKEPMVNNQSAGSDQPASTDNEPARGYNSEGSTILHSTSTSPKSNPSISVAKLHMRPSSILLLEITNKMHGSSGRHAITDGQSTVRNTKTSSGAINRLIPQRWKDQARRFEKSVDVKSSQTGFLTTAEMRKAQWHSNIRGIMLDLLRSRVSMALERIAVGNSHKTDLNRRIIPLLLSRSDDQSEIGITTIRPGLEQAIFLWFSVGGSPESPLQGHRGHEHRSSHSPPVSPTTCDSSILRFVPRQTITNSTTSPFERPHDEVLVPTWIHSSSKPQPEESETTLRWPYRQQYLPPTITLELPNDESTTINPTTYTRNLPIFDLPTLLGGSLISKLKSKCQENPALGSALSLNNDTTASGWVMVKGGNGTKGYKNLVQEIWRLWLFLGGRRWGADQDWY